MYYENYEELKNQLNYKDNMFKFYTNDDLRMLPFTTREPERVDFERGILPVLGELSRLFYGIEIDKDIDDEDGSGIYNKIIANIDEDPNFDCDEDNKELFNLLVEEYLSTDELIHPKLLLFVLPTKGEERDGEKWMAEFFKSIFFKDINFSSFLDEDMGSNVFIDFIVSNLKGLDGEEKDSPEYCTSKILENMVIKLFKKDLEFLLQHKSFLLKNIDLFMAYYYFFYLTQFALKSMKNECSDDPEEVFYLLDWEKLSSGRHSKDKSYKDYIEYAADYLLVNMTLIEWTSVLLGTKGLLPCEVISYVESHNDKDEILKYFKKWILEVRESRKLGDIELSNDISRLMDQFRETIFEALERMMDGSFGDTPQKSRVSMSIEKLAKKYFLKFRGGWYGMVLNVNSDLLLLISAVCIGNNKIPISTLFEEYEKRGLFFDDESKGSIEKFFIDRDLIDKQSDNGEVKYVKPIL